MTLGIVLLVLVVLAGFYMAWNIGANDVANAMGTSVGSGALTLRQAVIVAAFLEFSGAFFFGSHVSETIQNGIIDPLSFASDPYLLVYGMLSVLVAAGVWLQLASYYGWPVSTTHTIVGAIVGFGIICGGVDAVQWNNVFYIITSWVLSPLFGGLFSFLIFTFLRTFIFYSEDPLRVTKKLTPLLVFLVLAILSLIVLLDGLKSLQLNLGFWKVILWTTLISGSGALIGWSFVKNIKIVQDAEAQYTVIEMIFGYLQIMSACLMAFAHGANDVANAIGPLALAIGILDTGTISSYTTIPPWALALGGCGIVIGLASWGWRVIETIGKKITELTPSRGFAAEFGAAATIVIATQLGMPISTTHTLVGSVLGVGIARGMGALNLHMTRDIFISWLVTVPAGAFVTVFFFYLFRTIFHH